MCRNVRTMNTGINEPEKRKNPKEVTGGEVKKDFMAVKTVVMCSAAQSAFQSLLLALFHLGTQSRLFPFLSAIKNENPPKKADKKRCHLVCIRGGLQDFLRFSLTISESGKVSKLYS